MCLKNVKCQRVRKTCVMKYGSSVFFGKNGAKELVKSVIMFTPIGMKPMWHWYRKRLFSALSWFRNCLWPNHDASVLKCNKFWPFSTHIYNLHSHLLFHKIMCIYKICNNSPKCNKFILDFGKKHPQSKIHCHIFFFLQTAWMQCVIHFSIFCDKFWHIDAKCQASVCVKLCSNCTCTT